MFYLLFKDQWVEHQFPYLSDQAERARLDPTLPGNLKKFTNKRSPLVQSDQVQALYQIMSKELTHIDKDATIAEAYKKMIKADIHHLLVFHQDQFYGLLSLTDILPYKKVNYAGQAKVEAILNTVVLAAHESTSLGRTAMVLRGEKISSLVVLNDDLQVSGIVTVNDFLRKVSEVFP